MIGEYISINRIIEKINRFKIPGGYWNIEELKEWTYDALSAINDKTVRIGATKIIEIIDNKGKIPADVEAIQSIVNNALKESSSDYDKSRATMHEVLSHIPLEETTYIIVNGFIYTQLKEPKGSLTIYYYTVPLDEEGNPLIPDNRLYISAIEAYLQYMIAKRAFMQGKILHQQLQMLEQEWAFYLPAAINSQKMDIMKDAKRFGRLHNKYIN